MTSAPPPLAGGRYVPERLLGEGGRKRVWLARDTRLDRNVAVSIIKTEGLDEVGLARIRREAQAMARLGDHPNVVSIYDIGDEGDAPFIVAQYVGGGSLEERLARTGGPLDAGEAIGIATDVLRALAHAHRHGILHRDLKPGNIWLTEDGTAKLGDFGLALDRGNPRLTGEGTLLGTAAYMAPEQALGREPDPRADLYALGATLYEMLTGRPPFVGDDSLAVVSQHINTAPVAPSWHSRDVPPGLEALVLALLAKAPEDRPSDAEAAIEALAAVVLGEPPEQSEHAPNPLDRLAPGVFVGREREMEEMRSALDQAAAGGGRLVLVVGEPGIGKTRSAEHLTTYARMRGAQVLWGRCYEGEGAPAYWPWMQAIRSYVHDRDPDALRSELGGGAGAIAQIVSEVRERLGPLDAPPPLEPEQARFRLFDAITTFLRNASLGRPIVLILDDLHWADAPSLLLLQFLARELRDARLLVVGTYRDVELGRRHPLAQALGELARERLSSRVVLRGFSEHDVERFIEAASGAAPPPGLAAAVYEHTEGNPFFVAEIVRLLVAEERLEGSPAGGWSVDIPQGVREVVGRRLDHLTEECNAVLGVASVAGREFDAELLAGLTDLDADRLTTLLDEAVAARVISEAPRPVGRYLFSHAIIRQTLYDEIPPARRVKMHRRIADVIERVYAGHLDAHLAELAHHSFQAATGGDDIERAVRYASLAASNALERHASEEAVRLYDVALQALDLSETRDPERRCDLLLALGDAQWKAGEPARARQTLDAAAVEARAVSSPERLARAALGFGGVWIHIGRVDEDRIRLMEEALAALEPSGAEHAALRARLLARLAIELYYSDARERRNALSRAAVKLARESGDGTTLAFALSARHFAVWGPENAAERLELAGEIIALATRAGALELQLAGHAWRITDLLEIGDMPAVDAELETHARLAEELRQPLYRYFTTGFRATRALMSGDFANGERLAGEALAIARRARATAGLQTWGVQIFAMRRAQGRLAELEPLLAGLVKEYGATIPGWRAVYAAMLCDLGRLDEARAIVDDLAADDFTGIHRDANWIVAICALALATTSLGDEQRAARVYELLVPYGGINLVVGWPAMCYGPTDAYLAAAATTMRRFEKAEEHFSNALAANERIGARPWLANVQTDYARMLAARDAPGDRERALALLAQALAAATAIGMPGLAERALLLKLTLQGVASRDPTSSIDTIAGVVAGEREALSELPGRLTIVFSDIEGFTSMVERHGDLVAQEILRDHNAIVHAQVAAAGGVVVRSLGDGFMMSFPGAAEAVRAAVGVQRALDDYNLAPPVEPVSVRIGMHTGEAILEGDDFFGRNVILAARIAAQAAGGEILVSGLVRDLLAPAGEFVFAPTRSAELKGLAGTHELVPVLWQKT